VASYLDTSFLLKFYLIEPESGEAVAWLERNRGDALISSLSNIEVVTVLLRESSIMGLRAAENYREDCAHGIYRQLPIDGLAFDGAEELAETHSREYKLRSLDMLHLATALRHGVDSFGTYDKRLGTAAQALD
jgi:predicted nucleic acid-binding protein